jgi:ABC-2 type transport system ATP-binding protein
MIQVENLVKHFAKVRAVDGVSFTVGRGEILGLLGPNGAGKTTTIRTLMDIFKADSGTVRLSGKPITEASKSSIGYLPEERGLYKNFRVLECLTRRRAEALLAEVDLSAFARRRVKELSKGMNQKAQFLASIIHDPDVLILDEPFQGLDPVNTDVLKSILLREQDRGKTIILSTHNMNQVEEMCDRILLMHRGRTVLYGALTDIQAQYTQHAVYLRCDSLPKELTGVQRVEKHNRSYELVLEHDTSPQEVLRQLVDADVTVHRFEVATPPLEAIFISAVGEAP